MLIRILLLTVLYAKPKFKKIHTLLFAFLFEGFLCVFMFLSHFFQRNIRLLLAFAGQLIFSRRRV